MAYSKNGHYYYGKIPISYGAIVFLNGKQICKDIMIPKINFFDLNIIFNYNNNYCCNIKGKRFTFRNICHKKVIDKYIIKTKKIYHRTFKLYDVGTYGALYPIQIIYIEVYKITISYLDNQLTIIYGTYINPNWETWNIDIDIFGSRGFKNVLKSIASTLNISIKDLKRIREKDLK